MKIFLLTCSLCLWLVSPIWASEACPMDQGAWVYSQCVEKSFQWSDDDAAIEEYDLQEPRRPLRGTFRRDGNLGYSQWNDGTTGTSQRLGEYEYYNFSDGTRCNSTTLGEYTYVNCR
jgi:hypothetical protein